LLQGPCLPLLSPGLLLLVHPHPMVGPAMLVWLLARCQQQSKVRRCHLLLLLLPRCCR
jgi:hypothetical protein